MADSHPELVTYRTYRAAERVTGRVRLLRRVATWRGELEQALTVVPVEEEIGIVPSTPFTHPCSANDHGHVMVPDPFGGGR